MEDYSFRLKATLLEQRAEDVIEVNGRLYHIETEGRKHLFGGLVMNQGKCEYDERLFKDRVRRAIIDYMIDNGHRPNNYSITIQGEPGERIDPSKI